MLLGELDPGVGTASVTDDKGALVGVITDGDLRRALEGGGDRVLESALTEVMTPNPKTVTEDQLCVEVVEFMQRRRINAMPVPRDGRPYAMVHLHDLLAAGIVGQD